MFKNIENDAPIIVGVSGYKQSGKTSLCNYIQAYKFQEQKGQLDLLSQDDEGDIYLENETQYGPEVIPWKNISSPLRKAQTTSIGVYSFADPLKEFCINVLGLTYNQCYGSDEDKNSLTVYRWESMHESWRVKKYSGRDIQELKSGFMTAREVIQVFGTEICRGYFSDTIWVDSTFSKIKKDNYRLSLIADVRFVSEIEAIINDGGYVIRLQRKKDASDKHQSEIDLDNYDWSKHKDKVLLIDNTNLNISQKNAIAISFMKQSNLI